MVKSDDDGSSLKPQAVDVVTVDVKWNFFFQGGKLNNGRVLMFTFSNELLCMTLCIKRGKKGIQDE